jgi:hypothetical protein
MVSGITADGDPSDWDAYPLLEWAPIDHYCEGSGQEGWPTEAGGWNYPVNSDEDFHTRMKCAWQEVEGFPCLLILIEWVDDEFHFFPPEEGGSWDNTDVLQFWYAETLYDQPNAEGWGILNGVGGDYQSRQMNVYLIEGWGIRVYAAAGTDPTPYQIDPKQPYSVGEFEMETSTKAYLECQVQMFDNYMSGDPWLVDPGYSCLSLGISGCNDYDNYDGSFSYITWGLSNRDTGGDIRVQLSLIGFEKSYDELFGSESVESDTWGAIKSTF